MKVALIGYRCAGKTSVGRELSRRLGIPFLDTDELVVMRCGKAVGEIVREAGWGSFRRTEREVIAGLAALDRAVIAVGGGAVEDRENREVLRRLGLVIWLWADPVVVINRLKKDKATRHQRPPLSPAGVEEETSQLLGKRIPLYRELAQFIVDTSSMDIEAVADEICDWVRAKGLGVRSST